MTSPILIPGSVDIVGLSGKARSGKDYLARTVVVPQGYLPLSLANHFKISAAAKNPLLLIQELWETDKSDEMRRFLQEEGTERGRNVYGENIWLRHAELWMYYFGLFGMTKFVFPDLRFENEVEWVQGLGGRVFRIQGRGGLTGDAAAHPSETALDDYVGFDARIDNSPENERWVINDLTAALQLVQPVPASGTSGATRPSPWFSGSGTTSPSRPDTSPAMSP